MKRDSVNPWEWGLAFNLDQGELVEGAFTTDVDGFLANCDVYASWIGEAGIRPPQSLIGIQRLVMPELMVEIEAVAAD